MTEASEFKLEAAAAAIAGRWRGRPGAVTGALLEVQDLYGYLPEESLTAVARALDIPLSQVYGVATFFSFFRFTPRGNCHVQVCTGTACHVLGSGLLKGKLERDLAVKSGGLTADRAFSLEKVHCLGCCSLAPVIRFNQDTYGRVRQKDVARLLKPYRQSEAGHADQD